MTWFAQAPELLGALLDIAMPRHCAGCGSPMSDKPGHLCWDCLAQLPIIQPPYCAICGDPVDGAIEHEYACAWCTRRRPAFELARSAARYRGALKDILHRFKYSHATFVEDDLVSLLSGCARAHFPCSDVDVVTFVPLHRRKERERTYNQARLLASGLARELGKPMAACALRVRSTSTQTHLTAEQRAANVKNAFLAREPAWLDGRTVLLVDDVMTTGATVNECARALKDGGAARVFVATVARG